MFEVCSTAQVDKLHPCPTLSPGDRDLDRRARTRVKRPDAATALASLSFWERKTPGLAQLSAPNASGRPRSRYASRKRPFSGPGDRNIGDVGIYVNNFILL